MKDGVVFLEKDVEGERGVVSIPNEFRRRTLRNIVRRVDVEGMRARKQREDDKPSRDNLKA